MIKNISIGLWILLSFVSLVPMESLAETEHAGMEECLRKCLESAHEQTTVGELKKCCDEYNQTAADQKEAAEDIADSAGQIEVKESIIATRLEEEKEIQDADFILTPHRANFLIPVAYNNSPNYGVYDGAITKDELDNVEVKFQFSIKYMLFNHIFKNSGDIYFAYTNLSYWQAYNTDLSSPFRDTSHEPELWIQFDSTKFESLGFKSRILQLGAVHQSNGRSEPLSRSWNRLFVNFIFEKDNFIFGLKPWWRIPEKREEDNNPDIHKYLGYGEFGATYKWRDHNFRVMLRNNLRGADENRGAIEVVWSFPLYKKLKGYFQFFSGYGQTMLDYNDAADTFGIGIALSDII
jgi:phospholipase A1